jgi:hypothetical protein
MLGVQEGKALYIIGSRYTCIGKFSANVLLLFPALLCGLPSFFCYGNVSNAKCKVVHICFTIYLINCFPSFVCALFLSFFSFWDSHIVVPVSNNQITGGTSVYWSWSWVLGVGGHSYRTDNSRIMILGSVVAGDQDQMCRRSWFLNAWFCCPTISRSNEQIGCQPAPGTIQTFAQK